MRILFVFDHLEVGGTQTYGQLLSHEFLRAGHTVGVASRGGHTALQFADAGAQIIIWPAPRRTDLRGVVNGIRRARQIIAAWSPDVIHAHAALPGLSFSLAARRTKPPRPPLIFGPQRSWRSLCHFPGGQLVSWALYQLLRAGADEVIAVSEGLRREFAANGIPAARLHLIPNGIDLDQFDRLAAAPTDLSFPPGRIVGTVGRLVAQKGMDVFLQAARMIAPRQTDVTFVIAGDGPLRESCVAQIATLGLTGRSEMLGERRDIPALLHHLSVFVSASRWEGLPYALLEALAAQCPVVATRVLGSEELIHDGITGLLVPPDDPESLGRAILRLLDDPALARTLGANGRQLVNTRYRLQTLAEQVLAIYQQAIVVERPA